MSVLKGWKFPIEVDPTTGKIETIEDTENIRQDVRLILETQKFERKTIPEFGTDLRSFMFEIIDPEYISNLQKSVEASINIWERNVSDVVVDVNVSLGPVGKVFVNIEYSTNILPIREKVGFSLNGATVS